MWFLYSWCEMCVLCVCLSVSVSLSVSLCIMFVKKIKYTEG